VEYVNRQVLSVCDGVLVNLRNRAAAFGTIREVEFAKLQQKPVVVVSKDPVMSLSAYDLFQEDTMERGLARLVEVVKMELQAPQSFAEMLAILIARQQEVDDD
jgi:nucleoside 2-deoxyribosyltransferase